ncbi:MAG: O-antigen ligase family protein [Anaerolineales bacterium]|nr:O-antigen ligase family protein [Anaerolineales bacterium]
MKIDSPSPRSTSHWTTQLARFAFFATLALAPVRLRAILQSRPAEALYSDYTDFLLFIPDVILLITLIAWGFSRRRDSSPFRLGPALVWIPLAGLTASSLISAVSSVDASLSLYHALRLCLLFLFYLYIVNARISLFDIGLAVVLQGLLQAAVAIPQSILQRSVGLQSLGEYLLDPAWSGVSVISDGATRFLRAYGLSDHPNILGGCLAFSMIVLLTLYLRSERKDSLTSDTTGFIRWSSSPERSGAETKGVSRPQRFIAFFQIILFALCALALVMTFSRSAWLAFLAGAGFVIFFDAKSRGWASLKSALPLFACALLVTLPFVVTNASYFGARLNAANSFEAVRTERGAVKERIFLIEAANHVFSKHPLTGIGMSASPLALKNEIAQLPETFNYQPPHFTLLTVALETGMFGAIFYFLLLILPWVTFSRRADLRANPQTIGVMGLLLAITVVGFFDYYTWFSIPGRLWQWLAWGLFAVTAESPSPNRAERSDSGDEAARGSGRRAEPVEAGEGES